MKIISERKQRTIARPAVVEGIGYITGLDVRLCFKPAPEATGVVFVRTDLGSDACLPAHVSNVTGTNRRTTLGQAPLCVTLIEHVLSALRGLRIDNCFVELNAPEPPGLDGSAQGFVQALLQAGVVLQSSTKPVWTVEQPVVVQDGNATVAMHPATTGDLHASYLLDYGPDSPIVRQRFSATITPESFLTDIARCRTFVTQEEALFLRNQGLGSRTGLTDLIVFGPHGPLGTKLYFADEPARHKVLDMIGDLALAGADICGHVVAYRSGHGLNVELARTLSAQLSTSHTPLAA